MWTPGGQIDHITLHVCRGGGKGGAGSDPSAYQSKPIILTDPVNGKTFVQESNPVLLNYTDPVTGEVKQMPQRSAQEQLNDEIAQREADEKAKSDKAAADKVAADAAARETFNTRSATAKDLATRNVNQYFTSQGVDPTRYADPITNAILTAGQGVQDLDPNPSAAYDPNLGKTIFNDLTSGARARATQSVNDLFSPSFASDRLSYGAADPLINDILNEQFNPLSSSLLSARDRGTLTPVGYQSALDTLNQKRSAAQSQVGTIAHGVIDKDRTDINDLISGAKNAAGGISLSGAATFDPSTYRSQADAKIASDLSDLAGAIRSGIGGTKFVDFTELLNAGGSAQGATQPSITNPNGEIDPTVIAARQRQQQQRGLGSQGAF